MQNENRRNSKPKGFYILLALCVAVVGVSGYYFFSDASEENKLVQQTMSVPQLQPQQEQETPSQQTEEQPQQETPKSTEKAVMPVPGGMVRGYAMEQLSYNATTKDWRTHNGVDLAAEVGQEVKAAKSGTVLSVYDDAYYGMTVSLSHDDGYVTSYSGLDEEIPVQAGQSVSAGTVIGKVGDASLIETALESHLHFEVTKNGDYVDPASFLYQ